MIKKILQLSPTILLLLSIFSCDRCNSDSSNNIGIVSTPVFSQLSGTYNQDISITITSSTVGAVIYYTLDESTPTTDSTEYSTSILISGNGTIMTIKANAVKHGMHNSAEASAYYAIEYENSKFIDPSASASGNGSLASPYNSWLDVTFEAGTTYLQKRGTIAREKVTVDASGTEDNAIAIGAYGSGSDPIIQGSEIETGWEHTQDNIYEKTIDSGVQGLGMVAENGNPLKFNTWNTDLNTTFNSASAGSYTFEYSTNTMYVWCTDDADPDTHTIEVSRRLFGINGDNQSYITIQNVHIRYASLHGIVFANSNNITISNCTLEKLGGAVIISNPSIIQAGNGIEFGNSCSNCTVSGCTVSDIFDSGISPQTYDSNSTALNFIFTGCTVTRCGFAGVEIVILSNSGTTGSSISNVKVQDIEIIDCGKGWSGIRWDTEGRGIKVDADVGAGQLSDVLIERCSISGSAGEGVYIGGDAGVVTIHRSRINNNNLDGVSASSIGTTLGLNLSSSLIYSNGDNDGAKDKNGISFNVPSGQGFNIYHNTFYNNAFLGFAVWNHSGDANFINNTFYNSVASSYLYSIALAGAVIDFNCYYEHGTTIIGYDSIPYSEISNGSTGFADVTSFEANGTGSDPQLTDPANGIFTLQNTSSPCYQAGDSTTNITTDFAGNSFKNPPSIGAYEFSD